MDPVLEKRRVQIFIKPILEFNVRSPPNHLVGEGEFSGGSQEHLILRCDVHVDDLFTVVAHFELFMGPYVVVGIGDFADDAPNWEIVDVHLVPIVVLHCVDEFAVFFFGELDATVYCLFHINCNQQILLLGITIHIEQ